MINFCSYLLLSYVLLQISTSYLSYAYLNFNERRKEDLHFLLQYFAVSTITWLIDIGSIAQQVKKRQYRVLY
jgi:hypothetical protein